MGHKIRLAVMGGGYWGKNLIRNFSTLEEVEVKLLCDLNEEALKDAKGLFPSLETSADIERIFQDDAVDGVVIVTPPSLHYQPAKKALTAGKHIFIEKPMAMSYQEGKKLVELADEKGKVLFVDETFLYDPALQVVKEMIDGGEMGKIYHVLLERLGIGRIRCESNVWWNSAPHDLSILRYLIKQEVRTVSLRAHAYLQDGIEDVALASLEMEDNISVSIHLSWFHPISTASLVIVGSKGAIFYEGRFKKRRVVLYRYHLGTPPTQRVQGVPTPNFIPIQSSVEREITDFGSEEPLRTSCLNFIMAIAEGIEPPTSGRNSLRTLKVLEAGEVSMRAGGKAISLEEIGP